jgi:hypothetical protein
MGKDSSSETSYWDLLDEGDQLFREGPVPKPMVERESRPLDRAEVAVFNAIGCCSGDAEGALGLINKLSAERASGDESLPVEGSDHEAFQLMGFELGEVRKQSTLFRNVKYPEGWTKISDPEDPEGRMTAILDTKGRWRVSITHLGQFWDDYASCTPLSLYRARSQSNVPGKVVWECLEGGTTVIHTWEKKVSGRAYSEKWWAAWKEGKAECEQWLTEHYPDWRNCLAYWDDYPKTALERVSDDSES